MCQLLLCIFVKQRTWAKGGKINHVLSMLAHICPSVGLSMHPSTKGSKRALDIELQCARKVVSLLIVVERVRQALRNAYKLCL